MPARKRYERHNTLAFQIVRAAHDRGFRYGRMADESAFHFHCADSMSGNIDDVVDAAHDPEISIFVAARAVTGEVHVGDFAPVLPFIAFRISINRAHHRRPWTFDDEKPPLIGSDGITLPVHNVG